MPTDPIKLLKQDHKEVKDLFKEFESADGRSKRRIANEAMMELEIHAAIEEEIFYPAVQKATKDALLMAEAEEEHHVAKNLIAELKQMPSMDVHFEAKFTVLAENVRHHIKEEEDEMLPKAAKMEKAELERLGDQMMERKEALKREMSQAKAKAS